MEFQAGEEKGSKSLSPEEVEAMEESGGPALRRHRRTPSKLGNFYELEDLDGELGGEEDEVLDDGDDSDEDPSWDVEKKAWMEGTTAQEDDDWKKSAKRKREGATPRGRPRKMAVHSPASMAPTASPGNYPRASTVPWYLTSTEDSKRNPNLFQYTQNNPMLQQVLQQNVGGAASLGARVSSGNPGLMSPGPGSQRVAPENPLGFASPQSGQSALSAQQTQEKYRQLEHMFKERITQLTQVLRSGTLSEQQTAAVKVRLQQLLIQNAILAQKGNPNASTPMSFEQIAARMGTQQASSGGIGGSIPLPSSSPAPHTNTDSHNIKPESSNPQHSAVQPSPQLPNTINPQAINPTASALTMNSPPNSAYGQPAPSRPAIVNPNPRPSPSPGQLPYQHGQTNSQFSASSMFQFPFRNIVRPQQPWPMMNRSPDLKVQNSPTIPVRQSPQPEVIEKDMDPQQRALHSLVRQCESYANHIRGILTQWKEKSEPLERTQNPISSETEVELLKQPENLKNELRSYQLIGLNWLYLLFQQKINGILADEMGLGKTIQTISLFAMFKLTGEVKKPHLIIVPATALENWVREFSEWCPSIRVQMYHGSAKERESLRKQLLPKEEGGPIEFDVVVTTYNLCINKVDRVKFFKKLDFSYIVLDEAHNIKNVSSVRYQNLLKLAFRAEYRLMLTGTPLQNNINELWALLNFLMPNIFGCTKDFKNLIWPEDSMENKNHTEDIEKLQKIISPFLLRRIKTDVLGKLPKKSEKILWCELTSMQRDLYQKTYQSSKSNYHAMKYIGTQEQTTAGQEKATVSGDKAKDSPAEKGKELSGEKEKEESPLEKGKESEKEVPQGKESEKEILLKQEKEKESPVAEKEVPVAEEKGENTEETTLHHILMQLRKASNNPLLFRHIYDADKLHLIEETLKAWESAQNQIPPPDIIPMAEVETSEPMGETPKTSSVLDELPLEKEESSEEKAELPTENGANESDQEVDDDNCGACGQPGDLLCCDGPCSRAFHLKCVGFSQEPEEEEWFCEDCSLREDKAAEPSIYQEQFAAICSVIQHEKDEDDRKRCTLFMYLPSKTEYADYYEIIKNPISLNQIKRRPYQTREQFRDDFLQLFKNAKIYNAPNSFVYRDAAQLERTFKIEFSKQFPDLKFKDVDKKKKASENKASLRRSTRAPKKRYEEEDDFWQEMPEPKQVESKQSRKQARERKKLTEPFLSCLTVLENVMDDEGSIYFTEPVDPVKLGLDDYLEVVKKPMDLGTVRNLILSGEFKSTDDFVDHVRLVFDNCLLYNEPTSPIGHSAQLLWTFFKRQCRKYNVPVKEASLANKNFRHSDLSHLAEELEGRSDIEIHNFCKSHECLSQFCLTEDQICSSSGKLLQLKGKLSSIHKKQHRVLIFSQFTQVLNILEEFLECLGFKFLRLDGQTPVLDRQMLIDEFNTDKEIFVFLLSTRAGGLGINLTSANICIFHDIDWNPEMDRQAEARVHRIGQTKPVKIYKLLSKNSVDEYILKMAESKKERNDLVMGESDKGKQSNGTTDEKLSIGKVLASLFQDWAK